MKFRIIFTTLSIIFVFFMGCSTGGNTPVTPSGENSNQFTIDDLRSLAVDQTDPGNYWSVPLNVDGEIWASHYNENGTLHRAIGPAVDAPDPMLFISEHPEVFLVNPEDLIVLKDEYHDGIRYLIFNQTYNGIPVAESRVDFRYARSGRLVMIGSDVFPFINVSTTPSLSYNTAYEILASDVMEETSPEFNDSTLVIYPVPDCGTLAWRIDAGDWRMYIDANSGAILKRIHNVWDAYTATIESTTKMTSPLDPEVEVPGSYAMIGYADGTGFWANTLGYGYSDIDGASIFVATRTEYYVNAGFRTPWANIKGGDGGPAGWLDDGTHMDYVWDDSNSKLSERIVYYWMHASYDYVKNIDSTCDALDFVCRANVNNSPMCNANASSTTMNFYQPADGCADTGHVPDVIIHEYGHVLTFHQYSQNCPIDVHEGCSDYFAATITDQSHIGNDIRGEGTMFRNTDNNYKFPAPECGGEPHCTGNILSGAFWDTRQILGREYTDFLFHFSRYGEPLTFHDFTPEIIILDDDNDNPLDGSANYEILYETWYENHNLELPAAPDFPTDGINIELYPVKPPVKLSASDGGTVDFKLRLTNEDPFALIGFHVWAEMYVPWYGFYGPLIPPGNQKKSPIYLQLDHGQSFQLTLHQWIPPNLPPGTYTYHVRVGTYNPQDLMDDAWFDIILE